MVPERGYVFSQPLNFGIEDVRLATTKRGSQPTEPGLPPEIEERLSYTTEPRVAFPVVVRSLLPESATQVRLVDRIAATSVLA